MMFIRLGFLALIVAFLSTTQAAPVPGQGTWETTLHARDLNGDTVIDAWYDQVLDISWLADAGAGAGSMEWDEANAWAESLDVFGVSGWRLPKMLDTGNSGCDLAYVGTDCGHNVQTGDAATIVYSELASMWYDTLGNKAYYTRYGSTQRDWGLSNTGPFSGLLAAIYWTGTEYARSSDRAWTLSTTTGMQIDWVKSRDFYVWAVHSGDVRVVPLPATAWLFGGIVLALSGFVRVYQA